MILFLTFSLINFSFGFNYDIDSTSTTNPPNENYPKKIIIPLKPIFPNGSYKLFLPVERSKSNDFHVENQKSQNQGMSDSERFNFNDFIISSVALNDDPFKLRDANSDKIQRRMSTDNFSLQQGPEKSASVSKISKNFTEVIDVNKNVPSESNKPQMNRKKFPFRRRKRLRTKRLKTKKENLSKIPQKSNLTNRKFIRENDEISKSLFVKMSNNTGFPTDQTASSGKQYLKSFQSATKTPFLRGQSKNQKNRGVKLKSKRRRYKPLSRMTTVSPTFAAFPYVNSKEFSSNIANPVGPDYKNNQLTNITDNYTSKSTTAYPLNNNFESNLNFPKSEKNKQREKSNFSFFKNSPSSSVFSDWSEIFENFDTSFPKASKLVSKPTKEYDSSKRKLSSHTRMHPKAPYQENSIQFERPGINNGSVTTSSGNSKKTKLQDVLLDSTKSIIEKAEIQSTYKDRPNFYVLRKPSMYSIVKLQSEPSEPVTSTKLPENLDKKSEKMNSKGRRRPIKRKKPSRPLFPIQRVTSHKRNSNIKKSFPRNQPDSPKVTSHSTFKEQFNEKDSSAENSRINYGLKRKRKRKKIFREDTKRNVGTTPWPLRRPDIENIPKASTNVKNEEEYDNLSAEFEKEFQTFFPINDGKWDRDRSKKHDDTRENWEESRLLEKPKMSVSNKTEKRYTEHRDNVYESPPVKQKKRNPLENQVYTTETTHGKFMDGWKGKGIKKNNFINPYDNNNKIRQDNSEDVRNLGNQPEIFEYIEPITDYGKQSAGPPLLFVDGKTESSSSDQNNFHETNAMLHHSDPVPNVPNYYPVQYKPRQKPKANSEGISTRILRMIRRALPSFSRNRQNTGSSLPSMIFQAPSFFFGSSSRKRRQPESSKASRAQNFPSVHPISSDLQPPPFSLPLYSNEAITYGSDPPPPLTLKNTFPQSNHLSKLTHKKHHLGNSPSFSTDNYLPVPDSRYTLYNSPTYPTPMSTLVPPFYPTIPTPTDYISKIRSNDFVREGKKLPMKKSSHFKIFLQEDEPNRLQNDDFRRYNNRNTKPRDSYDYLPYESQVHYQTFPFYSSDQNYPTTQPLTVEAALGRPHKGPESKYPLMKELKYGVNGKPLDVWIPIIN